MENRRAFLKKSALAALALSLPATTSCCAGSISSPVPVRSTDIESALVAWHSQTGNTRRHGRLMAKTLEAAGVEATACNLNSVDQGKVPGYDLIIIGAPVFYYDAPAYVQQYLLSLPDISGVPVASYVTFGGPEGNQHNAACSILECLVKRGGVPIAIDSFMNMGTYPLSWSDGKVKEHTWASRHLPDAKTYQRVRQYAKYVLEKARRGQRSEFSKKLTLRETLTYLGPIWWTKQSIDKHYIMEDKCIACGTCLQKCPVGAIDLATHSVDRDRCVLCFGCLNNCPAQAVYMGHAGEALMGYLQFMTSHNLEVSEPPELAGRYGGEPL